MPIKITGFQYTPPVVVLPPSVRIVDSYLAAAGGASMYSGMNGASSSIQFLVTIGDVAVSLEYADSSAPALILSGSPATSTPFPQVAPITVSTTTSIGGETKTVSATLTGATVEYVETVTRTHSMYGSEQTWTQPIYRIVVDENGRPTTGTLTCDVSRFQRKSAPLRKGRRGSFL